MPPISEDPASTTLVNLLVETKAVNEQSRSRIDSTFSQFI